MLKNRLPFRLGTTSYVIPDEIIPNVRFLSDRVDDIETVLFEAGGLSNIPSVKIVRDLKDIAADHDLAYTVHLPIDIQIFSEEDLRASTHCIAEWWERRSAMAVLAPGSPLP